MKYFITLILSLTLYSISYSSNQIEMVDEIARKITSKSTTIIRLGRRAFYTMRDMEYEKALEYLSSMLAINTMAEDVVEGISAFLEKREARWKGK